MIKIERKNKTEDGQVEIESHPDDKDDKKRISFSQVIFAGLRKWPFALKNAIFTVQFTSNATYSEFRTQAIFYRLSPEHFYLLNIRG